MFTSVDGYPFLWSCSGNLYSQLCRVQLNWTTLCFLGKNNLWCSFTCLTKFTARFWSFSLCFCSLSACTVVFFSRCCIWPVSHWFMSSIHFCCAATDASLIHWITYQIKAGDCSGRLTHVWNPHVQIVSLATINSSLEHFHYWNAMMWALHCNNLFWTQQSSVQELQSATGRRSESEVCLLLFQPRFVCSFTRRAFFCHCRPDEV